MGANSLIGMSWESLHPFAIHLCLRGVSFAKVLVIEFLVKFFDYLITKVFLNFFIIKYILTTIDGNAHNTFDVIFKCF